MLRIKTVTAKNFLSIGNATQSVDFNRSDITLVLGENIDLGGDAAGSKNGVGKTAMLNALSYGLYGSAISDIKKDNLINKTNSKAMLVTVEFEKDGIEYKIERGRKPNTMAFYVGNVEKEITDEAQGDSRETQQEIEHMLGMSHDMFKHICALNTYTEPFLSLRANDQRTIIEQLLGITVLSEKAEKLKESIKENKEKSTQEEFRIKAVTDANKRIEEQIESFRKRQRMWTAKHRDDIAKLQAAHEELSHLDIVAELTSHQELSTYNLKVKDLADLAKAIRRAEQDQERELRDIKKLEKDIAALVEHRCHACGQDLHDDAHEKVLSEKEKAKAEANLQYLATNTQLIELTGVFLELGSAGIQPKVYYPQESDAFDHRSSVDSISAQLVSKQAEIDPYTDQINEMSDVGIEVVSYDYINQLAVIKEHQEFLLKLLTNKDSFVRKRIIDQNLSYLNARLGQYLDRIGLPHSVKFNNDLTVSITELGRDLDFDNLSRGERNRLILSLSWAFRDVWESLYQPINLMFIDELVDSGLDSNGMENTLAILKKMCRESDKSVWLVSHRDELIGRVSQVLKVVKCNGFTTYSTDTETA